MYQVQSNLHVPYTMEAAISLERQVTKNATISLTYLNSRGVHQLFLRNANAPLPGTYNPTDPNSGIRPFGEQHQRLSVQLRAACSSRTSSSRTSASALGQKLSLFGFYSLELRQQRLGSGGPISIGQAAKVSEARSAEVAEGHRSS